ncbi:MAG: hypothetical protein ACLR23_06010 [Clostridia bacterium]
MTYAAFEEGIIASALDARPGMSPDRRAKDRDGYAQRAEVYGWADCGRL